MKSVLERLLKQAEEHDPAILAQVREHVLVKGLPFDDHEPAVARLLKQAFIPVSPEAGQLLYILARSTCSRNIVEFGTSFGVSTLHLAVAARENGGHVISTELDPEKVVQARLHVREAGLADVVEIREGDARQTLRELDGEVDFLFLDGWKSMYLPVFQVVEHRLRSGSLVVADDLGIAYEAMKPFLDHVRNPSNGFASLEVPLGDGMELSVRTG